MEPAAPTWRQLLGTVLLVLLVVSVGCGVAFFLWLRDVSTPQVAILGSGNRLSVLVSDGPARLVLATGNDPVAFGNAMSRFQPIFARRIDVLLLAGQDQELLVPWAIVEGNHARATFALAPLLPSPESDAIGMVPGFAGPRRVDLGPSITVTVETVVPYGVDPSENFPAWRAIIERGDTRIIVLSDGKAAEHFPPGPPASVLVVSGGDPTPAWMVAPAVALVSNEKATDGPELRSALLESRRPPRWAYRVSSGEALRLRFVDGGVSLPDEPASSLGWDPAAINPMFGN